MNSGTAVRNQSLSSLVKNRWDPRMREIYHMIRAQYAIIHVVTPEEQRLLDKLMTLHELEGGSPRSIVLWSATTGFRMVGAQPRDVDRNTADPDEALRRVLSWQHKGTVFVFLDLHHYYENPLILRLLRDCANHLRGSETVLLLVSPSLHVPPDLEKDIAVVEFPLPTEEEHAALVDRSYEQFKMNPSGFKDEFTPELRAEIIRACSGLTDAEASDALAKALIECGGITIGVVNSVNRTKREAIRKTQCLEAIDALDGLDSVGGLDSLKEWVRKRKRTFTDKAREFGIEPPKGLLAMGVPGGGKGLAAKAIAYEWRLPLLRLDMGSVYGGLVGESESNLRSALRITEAIAPCILWVDEIEKGFAGTGSSDRSDGGTTARVFGTLLTWLQEKSAPVFCYFTANDVRRLPPELLRKGRVDEIFFIDLPNDQERKEILAIHLRKRGRDPKAYSLDMLVRECRGFVGAEIEQCVKEALVEAFYQERELKTEDLVHAFRSTIPMVRSQPEKILDLLDHVNKGRAVRASSGPPVRLEELGVPTEPLPVQRVPVMPVNPMIMDH